MKKEKALEYLPKFPELSEKLKTKTRQLLTPHILYNAAMARCTNCGEEFFSEWEPQNHCSIIRCPICRVKARLTNCMYNYTGRTIQDMKNAAVFLRGKDNNLYVRCFTLRMSFSKGKLIPDIDIEEVQRYVFTPSGSVRYGKEIKYIEHKGGWLEKTYGENWAVRLKISDPVFDNYSDCSNINFAVVKKTWLKYSMATNVKYDYNFTPIRYIDFYRKYPGAERLIKCGFERLVKDMASPGYYGAANRRADTIRWKETEVHKMLGVSRAALNLIRAGVIGYDNYLAAARHFPDVCEEKQAEYARRIKNRYSALDQIVTTTGRSVYKLMNYFAKNDVDIGDYCDYLGFCQQLQYDLSEDIIAFPPHFQAAHDRADAALDALREEERIKELQELREQFEQLMEDRKKLEFECGDYMIIQPQSASEIIREGKELCHCVGGYAERHMRGALTIMFLRKKSELDKPYYTIEVSRDLTIVQCRGYKNNTAGNEKSRKILKVEKAYQAHLDTVKRQEKQRCSQKAKSENNVMIQIGA